MHKLVMQALWTWQLLPIYTIVRYLFSEIQSIYRSNRHRDIELSSSILIYWVKRGRSLQTFTQQK